MTIDADRLNEIRQMCDAPSDGYSAGAWCEAANDLLAALDAAEQRAEGVDRVTKRMREAEQRAVQAEHELAAEKALRIEVAKLGADVTERAERAEQERDEAREERNDQGMQAEHFQKRAEAAEARLAELDAEAKRNESEMLARIEVLREWIDNRCAQDDTAEARLAETQKALEQLREAVASALTSLGTGPLKDGYAYSVLDAALTTHTEAKP